MAIRLYTCNFAKELPNLYEKQAHFLRTFGGGLEVRDGISQSDTFLKVKVSNAEDVILHPYDTGENVAFGTGTSNSSRFPDAVEIKSVDKEIPYEDLLASNQGVDIATVNDDFDRVVAETYKRQAESYVELLNTTLAKALSENAGKSLKGDLTAAGVAKAFAEAHSHFVNNNVRRNLARVAYVTPEVYNVIVESPLTTTGKHSQADIDNQNVVRFKGFDVIELPERYFEGKENVIFAADNVGVVGVGIEVARVIDSENFAGKLVQSLGKYGKYIPEENKKAIAKAVLTEPKASTPPASEG